MKRIVLLSVSLFFIFFCWGQEVRTLKLISPGTLSMQLSYNDLEEITDLTLSGSMNAKDFSVIALYMNNLKSLDLKDVSIKEYKGAAGPQSSAAVYPENQIPEKALQYKKYLSKVVLPDNLSVIREEAFAGCSNLSVVVIPQKLKVIARKAFDGCISLKSVDIPESVISIEDEAFNQCIELSAVEFHEGLQTIGKLAFSNCSSLEKIKLPHSLTQIGESAFANCKKLKHVYTHNPEPINISKENISPYVGISKNVVLYVPAHSIGKYSEAYAWNRFKQIKPLN